MNKYQEEAIKDLRSVIGKVEHLESNRKHSIVVTNLQTALLWLQSEIR